ncbi:MAG: PhzF family phenazine biosynthesis protein [Deltaproteobacteria bacterium HGW-Deltaproteobacteria-10]|nr:MAG: PhzF family phenazine biosynthesis protein [Deltaproteobacteria bacterium HGW-Deltaproteobacteria-10]
MKSFSFKKIDAFTKGLSGGNPCACIYLNGIKDITDQEMQTIARELQGFVNEVVYLFPEENNFLLKYYSAECEVNFCGHGTIGIMYDLISSSSYLFNQEIINIRVQDTILKVYNKIKESDSVFITAPPPAYNELNLEKEVIARALNIVTEDINTDFKPALINAGLNTLIVPIKKLKFCLAIMPDQFKLKDFCLENGIDIILIFTDDVANKKNKFRTRVFAPKFGYLEDPATGSGNSAFGNYLLQNNLWDGALLNIEQNSSYDSPNIVKLDTAINKEEKNVIFGGAGVVRIQGIYNLA